MLSLAQNVIDVNLPSAHLDPAVIRSAKYVNVLNHPASGASIDTYTKLDVDAQIRALNQRIDTLAQTVSTDSPTCMSKETRAWIDKTVVMLTEKCAKYDTIIENLIAELESFEHNITELLQIPEDAFEPAEKEAKTESAI